MKLVAVLNHSSKKSSVITYRLDRRHRVAAISSIAIGVAAALVGFFMVSFDLEVTGGLLVLASMIMLAARDAILIDTERKVVKSKKGIWPVYFEHELPFSAVDHVRVEHQQSFDPDTGPSVTSQLSIVGRSGRATVLAKSRAEVGLLQDHARSVAKVIGVEALAYDPKIKGRVSVR